jgi:hypothetical protein
MGAARPCAVVLFVWQHGAIVAKGACCDCCTGGGDCYKYICVLL